MDHNIIIVRFMFLDFVNSRPVELKARILYLFYCWNSKKRNPEFIITKFKYLKNLFLNFSASIVLITLSLL